MSEQEENEINLIEGEYITNIDEVDPDWWIGQNSRGERGCFPSDYVLEVGSDRGKEGRGSYSKSSG